MAKRPILIITLLLLLLAFFWTRERTRHYIGHHDWDNIYWTTAAENYQRYGLLNSHLQVITDPIELPRSQWSVNQHHPPGISIITFFSITLFGDNEFAARLAPLGASALSAALLFALVKRLYNTQTAILSLFFWGFTPLMIYFSAKIGHEQFTLMLMLITLLIYTSKKHLGWLFLIGFLGAFISWAWYLFLALLMIYTFLRLQWSGLKLYSALWVGGFIGGLALLIVMTWQNPHFIDTLISSFQKRTSNDLAKPITLSQWLVVVPLTLLWLPTPVVTFFAVIGLRSPKYPGSPTIHPYQKVLMVLALTSIIYCLVFWQAAYFHSYLIYYLVLPLCVWASIGYQKILFMYGRRVKRTWRNILLFLLCLFLVGSARWTKSLYTVDTNEQRYEWGVIAAKTTNPGEILLTNMPDIGPHISYYARRQMNFMVEPEQIIAQTYPADWGFYFFCPEENANFEWINNFESQYDPKTDCYLIDLKK